MVQEEEQKEQQCLGFVFVRYNGMELGAELDLGNPLTVKVGTAHVEIINSDGSSMRCDRYAAVGKNPEKVSETSQNAKGGDQTVDRNQRSLGGIQRNETQTERDAAKTAGAKQAGGLSVGQSNQTQLPQGSQGEW